MSLPEGTTTLVGSVIDAMKSNPSCLAALIFALILAALVYLSFDNYQEEMHARQMAMIERCFPLMRGEKQ